MDREAALSLLRAAERPEEERIVAAQRLAELGATDAVDPMLAVLQTSEGELRRAVIAALHTLGATTVLLAWLSQREVPRRQLAAHCLMLLADPAAEVGMIEALPVGDMEVQVALALAIAAIGSERGLRALAGLLADAQPTARGAAALAIGRFRSNEARGILERALARESDPTVRGLLEDSLREVVPTEP